MSAPHSRRRTWTVVQHGGPDHLGLCIITNTACGETRILSHCIPSRGSHSTPCPLCECLQAREPTSYFRDCTPLHSILLANSSGVVPWFSRQVVSLSQRFSWSIARTGLHTMDCTHNVLTQCVYTRVQTRVHKLRVFQSSSTNGTPGRSSPPGTRHPTVSALLLPMQRTRTTAHHDGPNHLGLCGWARCRGGGSPRRADRLRIQALVGADPGLLRPPRGARDPAGPPGDYGHLVPGGARRVATRGDSGHHVGLMSVFVWGGPGRRGRQAAGRDCAQGRLCRARLQLDDRDQPVPDRGRRRLRRGVQGHAGQVPALLHLVRRMNAVRRLGCSPTRRPSPLAPDAPRVYNVHNDDEWVGPSVRKTREEAACGRHPRSCSRHSAASALWR